MSFNDNEVRENKEQEDLSSNSAEIDNEKLNDESLEETTIFSSPISNDVDENNSEQIFKENNKFSPNKKKFENLFKNGKIWAVIAGVFIMTTIIFAANSSSLSNKLDESESIASNNEDNYLTSEKNYISLKKEYDEYKEKMKVYEELSEVEAQQKIEQAAAEKKAKEEQAAAEKKAAEDKAAADKAAAEEARKAEEAKGYETGITYDQLARTPDNYDGKKVKFSGEVIQVMEGDTGTTIRFKANNDYDQVILCTIPKSLTSNNRVLDGDKITISGVSKGLYTYTSTMGGEITIPSVYVDIIN